MSRPLRLAQLLQVLRGYRRPVRGQRLADQMGVSLRTLYRDIATLREQGADLHGDPGYGFFLEPGEFLPPLTLPALEVDALSLGLRWVAANADPVLADAARSALARISHALPEARRQRLHDNPLGVGPARPPPPTVAQIMQQVREALAARRCLQLAYRDAAGEDSVRTVWPVTLGIFMTDPMLAAWCETRAAFRHFRLDRVQALQRLEVPIPATHPVLIRRWRKEQGIEPEWEPC
ncbi:YafY family protein [Stenotrophomonas sp. 24(2023)]|uniref:helix-turn-helix transcriptional regulator n=1 Tax=Stenotrophomonas sp. 24(2023) TaxID=3068324 RepID=UPI0027E0525F|nr:YafY family protein [Stenotrophomonas sp. 24(2023)]WMJ70801.1 YafY family protein [Stenotrophomonas sp. 24(2023)]